MQPARLSQPACVLALVALLLLCGLAAVPARADLALAPTTAYVPLAAFASLESACGALQANSTPQAMYSSTVTSYVDDYMSNNTVTQAFVAAYFTDNAGWYWHVTQMGETSTIAVSAADFVNGVLPDGTTGKFAVYDTALKKLQAVDGKSATKVLCYVERTYTPVKKTFPWWAILIIVLGCVVVIALVIVVVLCCCCRKKKRYTDDDDNDGNESAFTSRSGSFSSRGTSRTGSSYSGTSASSSSFSSRGSSKSSGVTGSTGGSSDSESSATSSIASSSVDTASSSSMGSRSREGSSRGTRSRSSRTGGSSSASSRSTASSASSL